MLMAIYSEALESGLVKIIGHAKAVLNLCHGSRADLVATFSEGTHWRDYTSEMFTLFEAINTMERAALLVIEGADVIRRGNDACEDAERNTRRAFG